MEVLTIMSWFYVISELVYNFRVKSSNYGPKNKFRPRYHITSPSGWLHQPSGFVFYMDQYHIFYQYQHADSTPVWGHYVSDNLVEWEYYPNALEAEEASDSNGCYAGCAIVNDSKLFLVYTGKSTKNDDENACTQNLASSSDGFYFEKNNFNPVIGVNTDFKELKNPKVWKHFNYWGMLLAGSNKQNKGELMLYTSTDLFKWKISGTVLTSFGDMGYLWESPDYFELNGQQILMISARGMQEDGIRFRNLYQTGYVLVTFDYMRLRFLDLEISTATFNELDYGHDFYAAMTTYADDGRVLLVAYLGMMESHFQEKNFGWSGMLTLIRQLKFSCTGKILMSPVKEMERLRDYVLEESWYIPGQTFVTETKSFELLVNSTTTSKDVILIFEWGSHHQFVIAYSSDYGSVTIDRGGHDGMRKAFLPISDHLYFRIFVDVSSVEIFCGEGEVVFSSRIYPRKAMYVRVAGDTPLHITEYKMKRSIYFRKLNARR